VVTDAVTMERLACLKLLTLKYQAYIRTTHNAIIVLHVLMKSRALSAECLLGLKHSVLSALKYARFTVH